MTEVKCRLAGVESLSFGQNSICQNLNSNGLEFHGRSAGSLARFESTSTAKSPELGHFMSGFVLSLRVTWSNWLIKTDRSVFYFCLFSFFFLSFSASFASAIITTSFTLVGLLVALRTVLSLHPHSRHSYFGGVNPI